MFTVKLLAELTLLVILFLMLRKILTVFFPSPAGADRGEEPKTKAVKSILFLALGTMASICFFWLFYSVIYTIHNWNSDSSLVISKVALITPSLIFGFNLSSMAKDWVFYQFFYDSSSSMRPQAAGRRQFSKRILHALVLLPGCLLLAFQANTYLKIQGNTFYHKQFGSGEKVFHKQEVQRVAHDKGESVKIYLASGEIISTRHLSGNMNYFLDHFMK